MKNLKKLFKIMVIVFAFTFAMPSFVPAVNNTVTVEAAKIKLSKSKATLIKGQALKLEVKNTSKKVKWTTSDKRIATVNSSGKITAKMAGTTTITATVNKKTYDCKVTVEQPTISQSKLAIQKGKSETISLKGTSQKVNWASSNKSIATVNSKGKITAKKVGTAKITATLGNKKYSCSVTVKKASSTISVDGITLNTTSSTLKAGDTLSLSAVVSPSNATDKTVSWRSSDSTIASIDTSGLVTSLKAGTVTITATSGTKTASCTVIVDDIGTAINPLSAYNSNTLELYNYSKKVGNIQLQLKQCLTGADAEVLLSNYYKTRTTLPAGHQWVYMIFNVKSLSSNDETTSISDLLWYNKFYNSACNKQISNYTSGIRSNHWKTGSHGL